MQKTVIMKTIILFCFVICFFTFSLKSAKASLCETKLISSSNLVVAEATNENVNCKSEKVVTHFESKATLFGEVNNTFTISLPLNSGDCGSNKNSNNLDIGVPTYGGYSPLPDFEIGQTYLMSVLPIYKIENSEYRIPECDRIFDHVFGLYDPIILLQMIRVISQPVWASALLMNWEIGYFLTKIFPSEAAYRISILIVLSIFGIIIYMVIKIVLFVLRKLRRKL